ncbi:MAG: AzlC family ABC transporter permease [Sinobacteraceae bacterium]|nr:AzlC family ABC transporter permease [Nevskiaceae bacterium]MCP5338687.1 AzlC family ABC transporter permease [Nevskiaceae bacterium]
MRPGPPAPVNHPPSPRDAFWRGVRELLPAGPGVFAWGLVTGVAMVKSGLTVTQSVGLTLLAYAGSAQLAALPLMASAAPVWVVAFTALIVNLRFVVYSAYLRSSFMSLPASRRTLLGYLVGDVMFVRYVALLTNHPDYPQRIAYYLGAAIANWIIWQAASLLGIFGAEAIPADWGLELAGTLALIALVVPLCAHFPTLTGVAVAGSLAIVARDLPLRLGLLLAVFVGMAAALLVESRGRPS